jgi:probable phosphoglycerate mutase
MDNTLIGAESRRRIYLLRHGDVSYVTDVGERVPDPELVHLTDTGQAQAAAMGDLLRQVTFDRAVCSGLLRTKQTIAPIIEGRGLSLEEVPGLKEIHSGGEYPEPRDDGLPDHVHILDRADDPELRWAGGEVIGEFRDRIIDNLVPILEQPGWNSMVMVLHGMVNRAVLSWVTRGGVIGMAGFEQDTCCLNIIDVDVRDNKIQRRFVRQVNVLPDNITMQGRYQTTLERGYAIWQKKQLQGQKASS